MHYSAPGGPGVDAANTVSDRGGERPDLVVSRKLGPTQSRNRHMGKFEFGEDGSKSLRDMAPPAGLEPATR